jgi:16S rRNA (guanine527-N7)-methyltransferase
MAEISMQYLIDGAKQLDVILDSSQLEQFAIYSRELVEWNKGINLTAITDSEGVLVKHFLDSLTLLPLIREKSAGSFRVIDVGTGAGFPGIPLKIALPDIKITLLEATAKKVLFLEHILNELKLQDIEIITGRAEEAAQKPEYREKFDVVAARAVADLAVLSELTLPFCAVGGSVIAQKKGDIQVELEKSLNAIETLGGRLSSVEKIRLEGLDDERYLVIIDKVKSTPDKYPRRSGMPQKRPIK